MYTFTFYFFKYAIDNIVPIYVIKVYHSCLFMEKNFTKLICPFPDNIYFFKTWCFEYMFLDITM